MALPVWAVTLLIEVVPDAWRRFWAWWDDRKERKAHVALEKIERRRAKRAAKKRHVKELLDAVENDDPDALLRASNRVRDDEADSSGTPAP